MFQKLLFLRGAGSEPGQPPPKSDELKSVDPQFSKRAAVQNLALDSTAGGELFGKRATPFVAPSPGSASQSGHGEAKLLHT